MKKYLVRNELKTRVNEITIKYRNNLVSERLIDHIKVRAATTKSFTDEIIVTLNQILEEQNIELDEDQEKELMEYLKPAILELIQNHFIEK